MAALFNGSEDFPLSEIEFLGQEGPEGEVGDVVPATHVGAEADDHVQALAHIPFPIDEGQDVDSGATVFGFKTKG